MRRLAWLTLLACARAAPDVDTLLARAAALARWANRTGPAPPSWTVTRPKDVTVGHEVHAGKIKKVYRGTTKADLGGASIIIKTIEHGGDDALIRHASAEDPDDRPSFAELVGAIDRRVEGASVN